MSDSDLEDPEYEEESILLHGTQSSYQFSVMTIVPPPLEYMAKLHSNQQEVSGRQVWSGSAVLCLYLMGNQSSIFGRDTGKILELGCGTGIVGMLAHHLHQSNNMRILSDYKTAICLTDGDDTALDLLQKNLTSPINQISSKICKGTKLLWGQIYSDEFETWCKTEWPDIWSQSESISFDIILAGDVLYKSMLPPLFFSTVLNYLSPGGSLFLCHIPRNHVEQSMVQKAARQAGLIIETLKSPDLSSLPECCPLYDAELAALYKISRARFIQED